MVLREGLIGRRNAAVQAMGEDRTGDPQRVIFLEAAVESIDAVLGLAKRYSREAARLSADEIAAMLKHVPAHRPRTFHEALQALRFLHAAVWLNGHYHVGLGRFDQYMMPFLRYDLAEGIITQTEAENLLSEFFISLNKDTDLYPGIQQGDNGQSLMLGGCTRDGRCAVNQLTYMVLRAASEVNMIDPKINLRVDRETDTELLKLAAQLTKQGLGFPQYSNDEAVIPGLVAHGYELEDARDYTVAACWEYIIPGKGMDVVNIGAVSFPAAVHQGIVAGLTAGDDLTTIRTRIRSGIREQLNARVDDYRGLILPPAPFYSCLMTECLESGTDISAGARYNNYGIHGAGSSNAADALAAVRRFVFEEKSVDPAELIQAMEQNWHGFEKLRTMMASGPRVGNDDPAADSELQFLFAEFADACETIMDNGRGGIVRPGTGSAMYYVWLARGQEEMDEPVVGATADGRAEGDFFSSSLAPSPGAQVEGPTGILKTYSKLDYTRICNGGPITLELSDSLFQSPGAIGKVAMLIKTFARIGCQQLQLNTLNLDSLLDAREHPERHRNLIVRVWGWSGYFCELAPEYQDHIIARHIHCIE